jgi:hypothetical protein
MMLNNSRIVIDYYDGAYGPTIRFDLKSKDDALVLKALFQQLTTHAVSRLSLGEIDGIRVKGVSEFVMCVAPEESEKSLILRTGTMPRVEWVHSVSGWQRCEALVQSLIDFEKPAHQYLTKEGVDDALVEVGLNE